MNRPPLRLGLLLVPLVLVCFALLPEAQAVTPAPDGGYAAGNTAEGANALLNRTTGAFDTAIGAAALLSDTTGGINTAVGTNSLRLLTSGGSNTAVGVQALFHNNGSNNTAVGVNALFSNTTGVQNTAIGQGALANNIQDANTAMGFQALSHNTIGDENTATGFQTLFNNTTGIENTGTGFNALGSNTTGGFNAAHGVEALGSNTTGGFNTAYGSEALSSNTTGNNNIAFGGGAGANLTTGNNNIDVGNRGVAGEANTIRIGSVQTRTFVAGIRGRTTGVANAVPVLIDSNGQLGTASSSRRFKNEIKPMDQTSAAILGLKPVTFHYKSDSTGTPQFGLIAEEVAEVNPDLVVRDENGEIYTVRYDAVNAMLLNEFLKEHRKVEKLEATVADQQKHFQAAIAKVEQAVTARLNEQAAQIQKVSAQIELTKPASQTVSNQ
jgi:Chaperone of endosialidase